MSKLKTEKMPTILTSDKAFKGGDNLKTIYQQFTLFLFAIMLILTSALSVSLVYFYQQSQQSKALINERLTPLNSKFQQQSYLINVNKLVDKVLSTLDPNQFIAIQENISLYSKKLTLLKSPHKDTYQRWFAETNNSTQLVTDIASRHAINELLKNNSLIQLDTLLDAINIQLKKSDISKESIQLFSKVEKQLLEIESMLQRLTINTSQQDFDLLQASIDEMFLSDYGKLLASQNDYNQAKEEIVRDFIRFEDLVIQRGLLTKWQASLHLVGDFKVQVYVVQEEIQTILNEINTGNAKDNNTFLDGFTVEQNLSQQVQIPLWLWGIYSSVLIVIAILLWVIRVRIKIVSQYGVEYFNYVLDNESAPQKTKAKNGLVDKHKKAFFCQESFELLQKIEGLNNKRFSEADYIALTEKNNDLNAEIVLMKTAQEDFNQALELAQNSTSEKLIAQLLVEQKQGHELHLSVIRQLILLGCTSLELAKVTIESNEQNSHLAELYRAHQQAKDLTRRLRQINSKRYLQIDNVVLTLSDISLVEQIQSILLNLGDCFSICQNKVCLEVDEKITTEVNLDVNLFTELFRVFIKLLFSQKRQHKLVLRLKLMDKNKGQQKIVFTGQIQSNEKVVKLPKDLASVNDESHDKGDMASYFNRLLSYQHGENSSAEINEQGYQLSFTLPFAVTKTNKKVHYPSIVLPKVISSIEQEIIALKAKFERMPIEVLLAVKAPLDYQRLQQLLDGAGLQVTFVTNSFMLDEYWSSGRYAVLLTDIPCSPFLTFIIDDHDNNSYSGTLSRGVFGLDNSLSINTTEEVFSSWKVGNLSADSTTAEVIEFMSPWLKAKYDMSASKTSKHKSKNEHSKEIIVGGDTENSSGNKLTSFDFERYCKNQGSAEIALYMLEEYTAENTTLGEQLSQAFSVNATEDVKTAINELSVNAKILAADDLLLLCHHWQKIIIKQGIIHDNQVQVGLLSKTTKAIEAINLYAESVA